MKLKRKPSTIEGFRVAELIAAKKASEEILKEKGEGAEGPNGPWEVLPDWVKNAVEDDIIILLKDSAEVLVTGGYASAAPDGWILQGASGEIYPATAESVKIGYDFAE